ncbi:MAG: NERD domain-containing protein [Gammaproteobacteria bacterium]
MSLLDLIRIIPSSIWDLIVLAVVASLVVRTRRFKGFAGEYRLRMIARLKLSRDVYHPFHNVMLRTLDGTTQIDHLFISRFGIFVVETKNMRGWIFGRETDARWTQLIYGYKSRFQNPLRQNFKHTKAVERALQVPLESIHSVIAFMGSATFKTPMPVGVTSRSGFVTYIKSFEKKIFTEEQVGNFLNAIARKQLSSEHILSVTHISRIRRRSDPNALRLCPICGSKLVVRTAQRGSNVGHRFWSCSTYPKCEFTQNIT